MSLHFLKRNRVVFAFAIQLLSGAFDCVLADEKARTRAEVNQEVIRTYAAIYLEQRDYVRAEDVIAQYLFLSTETGEEDLWFDLAGIQMIEEKFPEACHSYRKASESKNRQLRLSSLYGYAHCLNRVGRMEDSRKVLAILSKEEVPDGNAGARALELMESGFIRIREEFPPYSKKIKGLWRVAAGVGGGYDTNVLLLADSIAAGTPASGRASYFLAPAIQVGRVGRIFNDRFDSRLVSVYTHYLNPEVRAFNSSYTRADFQVGSRQVRWGAFADGFFLNRSPFQLYSWTGGLSWSLKMEETATTMTSLEIPVQFQEFLLDAGENIRTGGDAKIRYTKRYKKGSSELLSLQMVLDAQYTKGRNYRLLGIGLPAFYMCPTPLLGRLGFLSTFSAELFGQYYTESDVRRRDLLMRAGAGLLVSIGGDWNLSADFTIQKNLSSFDLARFTKEMIGLQVNHPL
ncbi:MAG: hypothetical protein KGP28_06515 [Bdellovibrionales bacterium]|nr:hypothetical protein [Bdellovibrionales bacterium]